jgi:nitrate/nitrite transporter NarK
VFLLSEALPQRRSLCKRSGVLFGRLTIGAIVGFIFALAGSPAAFGPLIAGYMYDATKSYNGAFVLSASLNLAALALLLALKKPSRAAL